MLRLIVMLSLSFYLTYEIGHSLVRMSCLSQFYELSFQSMTQFMHKPGERPSLKTENCSYRIDIATQAQHEFKSQYHEAVIVDFDLKLNQGFLDR